MSRSIVPVRPLSIPSRAFAALALAISGAASAGWPADPGANLAVADNVGSDQVLPKIVAATDGGAWISWYDLSTGVYTIRAQRIDCEGNEVFPHNGVLVDDRPQLTSLVDYDLAVDTGNNALIAFTEVAVGSDRDIRVTKVSPAGAVLWSTAVSNNDNFEANPRVVVNTFGCAIVVWGKLGVPAPGLMMQALDGSGFIGYADGGIQIAGDGVENPAFAEMVACPDGSVIVVWARDTRVFSSPRHLRSQKFAADGSAVWNAGAELHVSDFSIPIAHMPRIVHDGANGAVIAWHDSRGPSNVYVQRIDSSGALLLQANGLEASLDATRLRFDPALTHDPVTHDTYVLWDERTGSQGERGVYAQRFSAAGARMWGNNGAEILPVDSTIEGFIRAKWTDFGVMAAMLQYDSVTDSHVIALKLKTDATLAWGPTTIATTVSSKGRLPMALNSRGVGLLTWEDSRSGSVDVYFQNINPIGDVGPIELADLNADGVIGSPDLALLLGSWGPCMSLPPVGCCLADLDGDNAVGSGDLALLLGSWD